MIHNGLSCTLRKEYEQFELEVSFDIPEGELVSIIGPSGCGKSTTLQLITGLQRPDEGTLTWNGIDISNQPVYQRGMALVFQDYALYPHLNVENNIAYPLKLRKIKKTERLKRVHELLETVNLEGFGKRKIDSLSGGEKQRVALARALASDPKLLLLDEPLSALDAKLRMILRKTIRDIHDRTKVTMIYVTHDQMEALTISDHIIVMNDGKIEQIGTGEEIYHHPKTLFAASFIGEGNLLPWTLLQGNDERLALGNDATSSEKIDTTDHLAFIRPEDIKVIDSLRLGNPELFPYVLLRDATVTKTEYRGNAYLLSCRWRGYLITAMTPYRPADQAVSLSIRKRAITEFKDGHSLE